MNKHPFNFIGSFSFLIALTCTSGTVFAAQAPNPRGAGISGGVSASAATSRSEAVEVRKVAPAVIDDQVSRSATRRPATVATPRTSATPSTTGAVSSRGAARSAVSTINRPDTTTSRSGAKPVTSVARSATAAKSARSAVNQSNVSRAGVSRATAVFDDISKLGGGYATCRDAYNTCMDQFCAKANETYRRCYCSARFTDFRDTEAALDEAKTLLMRFEDNNLNAVDKSAAEVSAMYSATIGEQAIKNDTSGAQKTLNEIADLLSGKKKANSNAVASLSGLSLDFSADLGDIWGGDNNGDIFSSNFAQDISKLEGQQLYNAAHKQCTEMIQDSCDNNSTFSMAKSAYNILITQDCNAYEKKVDTLKEGVVKTVREAEKILRDARLEEYRAHNSADVNECVTAVKKAITSENACGANYKRCLDYTGLYVDVNTGEPIYSPQLFKLSSILNLNNADGDIAQHNPKYNQFMDSKKMYASAALDTCRDKSSVVWEEFKRSALIEIAQAQDAKIEEVKNTCVSTMAECYDTQSGALASFDTTTAQATGALNAYAARQMCADKVSACAALYAGPNDVACTFDNQGKLTNAGKCGLAALLTFVQTVDNYKVAEGCEVSMNNFINNMCVPATEDKAHKTPYGCRLMPKDGDGSVRASLEKFVLQNCTDAGEATPASYEAWDNTQIKSLVDTSVRKIMEDIEYTLADECDAAGGLWSAADDLLATDKAEMAYYTAVFGGKTPNLSSKTAEHGAGTTWGYCIQNTVRYMCEAQDEATGGNKYAKFNAANNTCTFTTEWYEIKCANIDGYYENGVCNVL
ncbi:MAG: hypothetical protein LBF37_03745 [Rickettsiales bacterium]|nr:hypothetical protein [Rickettsiales bacterium]